MLVFPDLAQCGQRRGLAGAGWADEGADRLRSCGDAQCGSALIICEGVPVAAGDAVQDGLGPGGVGDDGALVVGGGVDEPGFGIELFGGRVGRGVVEGVVRSRGQAWVVLIGGLVAVRGEPDRGVQGEVRDGI